MAEANGAPREEVTVLAFAASLREHSLNARLAELAAATIERNGGTVLRAAMREFDAPSYDQDVQDRDGFPAGPCLLRERLQQCDGFVVASPEYNASMPGVLKNVIDWVSRFSPQPFNEKDCLLLSASPSMVGGNRGLWALRVPFEHLGARVYPNMFSLAQGDAALAADGTITDPQLAERFNSTIVGWLDSVEAQKHYPCAKKRWFEYLGERPEPATDRAE